MRKATIMRSWDWNPGIWESAFCTSRSVIFHQLVTLCFGCLLLCSKTTPKPSGLKQQGFVCLFFVLLSLMVLGVDCTQLGDSYLISPAFALRWWWRLESSKDSFTHLFDTWAGKGWGLIKDISLPAWPFPVISLGFITACSQSGQISYMAADFLQGEHLKDPLDAARLLVTWL